MVRTSLLLIKGGRGDVSLIQIQLLKVIYHPLYGMKKIMSFYGVIGYHVTFSEGHMIANHPIYGVIGYHVTLSEGHMIANHPI